VSRFFTGIIVTYAYIFFSRSSSMPHDTPSTPLECSPTSPDCSGNHSFGTMLDARLFSTHDRSTSELLRTL
jgi:hypothetical protein